MLAAIAALVLLQSGDRISDRVLDCGNKPGVFAIYGEGVEDVILERVTVQNCNPERLANVPHGAITVKGGKRIRLYHMTVRHNADLGVWLVNCTDCLAEGGGYYHNGDAGISALDSTRFTARRLSTSDNGTTATWKRSLMIFGGTDVTVEDVSSSNNPGAGLYVDGFAKDVKIRNVIASHNGGVGITAEISCYVTVEDSIAMENAGPADVVVQTAQEVELIDVQAGSLFVGTRPETVAPARACGNEIRRSTLRVQGGDYGSIVRWDPSMRGTWIFFDSMGIQ